MNDNTPIDEVLFDMTVSLCDRFPAFTPLSIRQAPAREVFTMVVRYNKHAKKEKKNTTKDGKRIVRRPASDSWF